MIIHNILGIDEKEDIYFVEDSFVDLKKNTLSLQYLRNIQKDLEAKLYSIKDEHNKIIAVILLNPEIPHFRAVFTNIVSSNNELFFTIVKNLKFIDVYNTTLKKFTEALYEYYSVSLVKRDLCGNCNIKKEPYKMVYIESRNSKLEELLKRYKLKGEIIEICCGNGMSSLPLHKMGYDPITMDYNKCQICQGLEHNVLNPKKTVVLDAMRLSEFFPENSFDTVVGFMLGTIYSFNKDMWEKIMFESVKILKSGGFIMITVNKKEEIEILRSALSRFGINGEIVDNTDEKGIYDQWVFIGTKP